MKGPEIPTLRPEVPKGSKFSDAQRKLREIMKRTRSVPQTSEESRQDWEAWKKMNPDIFPHASAGEKGSETLPDPSLFRDTLEQAGSRVLFALDQRSREALRTYLDIYAAVHAGTEYGTWANGLHRSIDPEEPTMLTEEQASQLFYVLR